MMGGKIGYWVVTVKTGQGHMEVCLSILSTLVYI